MAHIQEKRRVVITGLGIMTTLGDNLKTFYESLMNGKSGLSHWKTMHCNSKIGGDLSDFNVSQYVNTHFEDCQKSLKKSIQKILPTPSLSTNLTALASLQALSDAGFLKGPFPKKKAHILAGHNIANHYEYTSSVDHYDGSAMDSRTVLQSKDDAILACINHLLHWDGLSFCMIGACASSNLALYTAFDQVRHGTLDMVLISGASNDISPIILDAWAMIGAISTESFNACPHEASRPFDREREGFIPSHGAAAFIVEEYHSAKKRNAKLYGEIRGASNCMNASRLPKPYLHGLVQSMEEALMDAGLSADQIDYINAHANSTLLGDKLEVAAIKQVFKEHAYKIPVNSTKSMLGHCLTAAGAIEVVATLLQLKYQTAHPTINQFTKDPELDLNFVPNHGIDHKMNIALSNNFGSGGYNSSIILAKI